MNFRQLLQKLLYFFFSKRENGWNEWDAGVTMRGLFIMTNLTSKMHAGVRHRRDANSIHTHAVMAHLMEGIDSVSPDFWKKPKANRRKTIQCSTCVCICVCRTTFFFHREKRYLSSVEETHPRKRKKNQRTQQMHIHTTLQGIKQLVSLYIFTSFFCH